MLQRVPIWKIVFIGVLLLLSLWILMPTIQFYSIDPYYRNLGKTQRQVELEQQLEAGEGNPVALRNQIQAEREYLAYLRDNSIRLGMDLQGGVHLAMEIDQEAFNQQLATENIETEQEREFERQMALDTAALNIENRVDQYGVAEAAVVKQPPNRLILEMPGYGDPQAVQELVNAEAQLSFHLVRNPEMMGNLISDIDAMVPENFQSLLVDQLPFSTGGVVAVRMQNVEAVENILQRDSVRSLIPTGSTLKWSNEREPEGVFSFPHKFLYLLKEKPEITGANLDDATVQLDPTVNRPEVAIEFDREGTRIFRRVTEENVNRNLAIVLDDKVYSAPTIQTRIPDGRARITGIGNFDEARQTAVVLRAGALPVPLNIVESRVVGPSLGADSIQAGIQSVIIGGILVLIFMIGYYAVCGVVADSAVILNLIFLVAAMALFQATLTLPGIAGVILTIGMAVDANVLIYERLREEMRGKRVKTVSLLLEKGYGRAFMTIFDANITTLITALVLFQFGTGPIKGFAVTLSLGIIISLFTAVFVTRVILDTMTAFGMDKLSTGSYRIFNNTNYNFLENYKIPMIVTIAFGLLGFIYLVADWNNHKGIDFAGGNELVVEFEKPVAVEQVRSALQQQGYPSAVIQRVLGEENQVLIRVAQDVVETPGDLFEAINLAMTEHSPTLLYSGGVSSKVGTELLWKGVYCLIFASIGILLYITARFEFRFAVASVAALFHDLFFTLAMLAILQVEFNLPIIAALLTMLGYSLNDTIVVFDRIRENYTSSILNFREMVNLSINQTLSRTVITSLTTLIVLIVMFFLGGRVIHDFCTTLIVGIIVGTYSSIFIASPILLMMGEEPIPEKAAKAEREVPQAA